MSLINIPFRQVRRGPANTTVLLKCLSKKCDGKGSKDESNEPSSCSCCNCSCDCSSSNSAISMYDARKYRHSLPGSNTRPEFQPLPQLPTDIFRCTVGEKLGPQGQASKCGIYLNPEYFSFHHMTYYDMHLILRNYRNPSKKTNRKPV